MLPLELPEICPPAGWATPGVCGELLLKVSDRLPCCTSVSYEPIRCEATDPLAESESLDETVLLSQPTRASPVTTKAAAATTALRDFIVSPFLVHPG